MPTYSITAPNGKALDITGDHVPTETELHDIFAKAGVETGAQAPPPIGPRGSERTRVDTNAVGVDHDRIVHGIADWASKLPPAWQKPAAMLATFPADALASLLEMFSAPETIATAGAKPAVAGMDAIAAKAATTREALHAPADALLDATIKKIGYDPEALQLAATRMRLQAARSQTRQAQMSRQITAAQASEVAAPSPAVSAPAEASPAGPPPQPGPRTVNDAMADAVKKYQAEAKAKAAANAASATSRAETAPGGTAPRTSPPPSPATGESGLAAAKVKLTGTQAADLQTLSKAEGELYLKLRVQGKTHQQAREAIAAMRTIGAKLPTDAQMKAAVDARNTDGRWKP